MSTDSKRAPSATLDNNCDGEIDEGGGCGWCSAPGNHAGSSTLVAVALLMVASGVLDETF